MLPYHGEAIGLKYLSIASELASLSNLLEIQAQYFCDLSYTEQGRVRTTSDKKKARVGSGKIRKKTI